MADFCKLLMGGCPPSPPQGKPQICAKRVNKNEFCWEKKKKKKFTNTEDSKINKKLDWANSAPTYPQTGHHSRHRF